MKINEQAPLTVVQQPQQNTSYYLNFEEFINTPTKQNSGDEYYWQHQSQLQKSALRFDAGVLSQYQEPHNEPNSTGPSVMNSNELKDSKTPILGPQTDYQQTNPCPTHKDAFFLQQIGTDLECVFVQPPTSNSMTKETLKTSMGQKIQKLESIPLKQINSSTVKNHHLFILGDLAELTINTQDLNPTEQTELKKMIQITLKQKGLALSKLIINGVQL